MSIGTTNTSKESGNIGWLKDDINRSFGEMRLAFSVDNEEYADLLYHCQTLVKQIIGALQIVKLSGASRAVKAMLDLLDALMNDTNQQLDQTMAKKALLRASMQLPAYLEHIQDGQIDTAIILLPLINDCRQAGGRAPISEQAVFTPDIAGIFPTVHDPNDVDLPNLIKTNRHQIHLAMLGLFRKQNIEPAMARLVKQFRHYYTSAKLDTVAQFYWVACAFATLVQENEINIEKAEIKLLFGKIETLSKRIVNEGEQAVATHPPRELVYQLLYHIALATATDGLGKTVKQAFKLDQYLPPEPQLTTLRETLTKPDYSTFEKPLRAMAKSLQSAKQHLNDYPHNEQPQQDKLLNLLSSVQAIAKQAKALPDSSKLQEKINHRCDEIKPLITKTPLEVEESDKLLADLASLIAHIEVILLAELDTVLSSSSLSINDIKRLVIKESTINMNRVKSVIDAFANNPEQKPDSFDELPLWLQQIAGSLQVSGYHQASHIVYALHDYAKQMQLDRTPPSSVDMQCLIDALANVDYYLDAVIGSLANQDQFLVVAENLLSFLTHLEETSRPPLMASVEEFEVEPVEEISLSHCADNEQAMPDLTQPLAGEETPVVTSDTGQEVDVTNLPMEEVVLDIPDLLGLEEGGDKALSDISGYEVLDTGIEDITVSQTSATLSDNAGEETPLTDGNNPVDPEMLAIFIEETTDIQNTLKQQHPLLQKNPQQQEALIETQRAFHTLKGSSGMIGLNELSQFAKSIEAWLDQIIAKTITLDQAGLSLIEQAIDLLPEILICYQQNKPLPKACLALSAACHRIMAGQPADLPNSTKDTHPVDTADLPSPTTSPLHFDELREIYTEETTGYINTLRQFIAQSRVEKNRIFQNDQVRILHTLHGNAITVGANSLSHLLAVAEPLVGLWCEYEQVIEEPILALLEALLDQIQDFLNEVNHDGVYHFDTDLLQGLQASYRHYAQQYGRNPELLTDDNKHPDQPEKDQAIPVSALNEISSSLQDLHAIMTWSKTEPKPPQTTSQADQPVTDTDEMDVDSELMSIFVDEANELISSINNHLSQWQANPDDLEQLEPLQRDIHTLNGNTRMIGFNNMGDLGYAMENVLTPIAQGQLTANAPLLEALINAGHELQTLFEHTKETGRDTAPKDAIIQRLADVQKLKPSSVTKPQSNNTLSDRGNKHSSNLPQAIEVSDQQQNTVEPRKQIESETIRVPARLIDSLINLAGENSVFRSRLEQQNGNFRFGLNELEQAVTRLKGQLRKMEAETEAQILFRYEREGPHPDSDFDPLEMDRYSQIQQLSKGLMESMSDLSSLQDMLASLTRDEEMLLIQQGRTQTQLQRQLMQARVVSFSSVMGARMKRIVNQTSKKLNKQVELKLIGSDEGIDRQVLDKMAAPLEHVLRNAIAHGIESPEDRKRQSKSQTGLISVSVSKDGSEMVIQVSDDGAGLDIGAIYQRAKDKNLIAEHVKMSDEDIMQLILIPGFSTSQSVTTIAGRGVGMDVVNYEVRQLGGVLDIQSVPGQGTEITMRLPFTLVTNQALLIKIDDELYAIPMVAVVGVCRISAEQTRDMLYGDENYYHYSGENYQLVVLGDLLGKVGDLTSKEGTRPALVMAKAGSHRVAFYVDHLLGHSEILVKPLGAQMSMVQGITGGAILGDGQVILILEMAALVRMVSAEYGLARTDQPGQEMTKDSPAIKVLVVDDSITVRRVTSRLLEDYDMDVLTAKDGLEAILVLEKTIPDIILLDVEMPRMDGYELANRIRNDDRYKALPILMITSRTGTKHRQHASAIGIDRYLGKPYQGKDLLDNIHNLVGSRRYH